jgi:uric acid permease
MGSTASAILVPLIVGGATVVMFGVVISSGIKIINGVDFSDSNNLLIIACSISLGLGATVVPELFAVLQPFGFLLVMALLQGALLPLF